MFTFLSLYVLYMNVNLKLNSAFIVVLRKDVLYLYYEKNKV